MPITFTLEGLREILGVSNSGLVYGPMGVGKTRSLVTLFNLKQFKDNPSLTIHLYDFDNKANSFIRAALAANLGERIVVKRIINSHGNDRIAEGKSTAKTSAPFLDFINDYNKSYVDNIDPKTGRWKESFKNPPGAVIFDSLTSFGDIVFEFVVSQMGEPGEAANGMAVYGKQMDKIMETITSAKKLPCINLWLAHDLQVKNEGGDGQLYTLPFITGQKLPYRLAKEFTFVLYAVCQTENNKPVFKWLTAPKGAIRSAGTTDREGLPLYVDQDFSLVIG